MQGWKLRKPNDCVLSDGTGCYWCAEEEKKRIHLATSCQGGFVPLSCRRDMHMYHAANNMLQIPPKFSVSDSWRIPVSTWNIETLDHITSLYNRFFKSFDILNAPIPQKYGWVEFIFSNHCFCLLYCGIAFPIIDHYSLGLSFRTSSISSSSSATSRSSPSSLNRVSWAAVMLEISFRKRAGWRTAPKLWIYPACINQFSMCATFSHLPLLQNNNLVAIINSPESVRNKDTCSCFLL